MGASAESEGNTGIASSTQSISPIVKMHFSRIEVDMFNDCFRNRRVLVTGDTGFKGSWLSWWLCELGANVHGLGLEPPSNPNLFETLCLAERINHEHVDIRDLARLDEFIAGVEPEIVFHLAAQPLVRESYDDPKTTFDTNVGGVVNVLECVRNIDSISACVVVTSDKCYENREWVWGYREDEAMGGHDPYSASKGAAELVTASYRRSFFADDSTRLATARAGNVIGGGDWAKDRILTDFVSNIVNNQPLVLRYPQAVRPWQHVCEPLSGYMAVAAAMMQPNGQGAADAWNFGPATNTHTTVGQLAEMLVEHWGRGRIEIADGQTPHEARILQLDCSKANVALNWRSVWNVEMTVRQTVEWYQVFYDGGDVRQLTTDQIKQYEQDAVIASVGWACDV